MSRKQLTPANIIIFGAVSTILVLVVVVIVIATRTITSTVTDEFRRQEQQIVETLARQTEFLFETLDNDLQDVASRPTVQAVYTHRAEALASLARMGERLGGAPARCDPPVPARDPLHGSRRPVEALRQQPPIGCLRAADPIGVMSAKPPWLVGAVWQTRP